MAYPEVGVKIPLLDHGYIQFIEHWGCDERIIEAARMSTSKGFLGWGGFPCRQCLEDHRLNESDMLFRDYQAKNEAMEHCVCKGKGIIEGDEKLLRYLYTEKPQHSTPFEMAGAVIEVQAPIMVYREWHRHRTQSYNEMSARYTPLPDLNYIPTVERLMIGSDGKNKQAGTIAGAAVLTKEGAERTRMELIDMAQQQERLYQSLLNRGVPKELARCPVGVFRYSRMRASANLLNWLKFMTLRSHHKAQWEIRQYADALGGIIATLFPRTWALFVEGRK